MNSRVALVVDPDANATAFHLTKMSKPGSKILKGNFELSSHRRCDVQHATLVENVRHREREGGETLRQLGTSPTAPWSGAWNLVLRKSLRVPSFALDFLRVEEWAKGEVTLTSDM